jgi:hypothetical protein
MEKRQKLLKTLEARDFKDTTLKCLVIGSQSREIGLHGNIDSNWQTDKNKQISTTFTDE